MNLILQPSAMPGACPEIKLVNKRPTVGFRPDPAARLGPTISYTPTSEPGVYRGIRFYRRDAFLTRRFTRSMTSATLFRVSSSIRYFPSTTRHGVPGT
jgi:hypothetical protein